MHTSSTATRSILEPLLETLQVPRLILIPNVDSGVPVAFPQRHGYFVTRLCQLHQDLHHKHSDAFPPPGVIVQQHQPTHHSALHHNILQSLHTHPVKQVDHAVEYLTQHSVLTVDLLVLQGLAQEHEQLLGEEVLVVEGVQDQVGQGEEDRTVGAGRELPALDPRNLKLQQHLVEGREGQQLILVQLLVVGVEVVDDRKEGVESRHSQELHSVAESREAFWKDPIGDTLPIDQSVSPMEDRGQGFAKIFQSFLDRRQQVHEVFQTLNKAPIEATGWVDLLSHQSFEELTQVLIQKPFVTLLEDAGDDGFLEEVLFGLGIHPDNFAGQFEVATNVLLGHLTGSHKAIHPCAGKSLLRVKVQIAKEEIEEFVGGFLHIQHLISEEGTLQVSEGEIARGSVSQRLSEDIELPLGTLPGDVLQLGVQEYLSEPIPLVCELGLLLLSPDVAKESLLIQIQVF